MNSQNKTAGKRKLDDAALLPPAKDLDLKLSEVGLENVQTQILLQGLRLPAKAEAAVSLIDKQARGIHMSRLFKILNHLHEQELSWSWLNSCLEQMLSSHQKLSDAARLQVSFELPVLRKALLSQEHGWRNYPITFRASSERGKRELTLITRVLYSSTCPCSAGLSRQALQEEFRKDFGDAKLSLEHVVALLGRPSSLVALPHSQRSEALCEFTIDLGIGNPSALSLIDTVEDTLGTAVQTAVKREDEQEFARRNAQNLMFCEDAARKLKVALNKRADLANFKIEVRHFESLHPHDVVAKVQKDD